MFSRLKRDQSRSPKPKEKEGGVFKRLGSRGRSVSARSDSRNQSSYSRYTGALSESEDSRGGHWKSRSKKKKLNQEEDDLSQPWVCEEVDPFTPRIRYFNFPKTRMPNHIKTYDGSEDPEDHLKIFQTATKTEHYDDLKKAFLENYLQQKKCIKDPIELHNIKQRDGEFTEDFVRRYKMESRDVKGAPECMRISGFMHGIINPQLIKRLHDKILKMVDEMMRVTTSFLRGEVAASNHERKKSFPPWKQQESGHRQNFKKGGFRNQQRPERKQDRFTLVIKTPKEIFALEKGKFKTPPPMTTPVEKQNHTKFCEFHGEVGHTTDECMHLKNQIEEMLKAGKRSHLIKEIKHNSGKEQQKAAKKGETSSKDKVLTILMVQPWERVARQKITQSFSPNQEIFFPPLGEDEGTKGPIIIEAEIGGHCIHRMYVDCGSASEILYEHCFSRLRSEIKNQLVPATIPLIGFSGEIIWPIRQIQLLVTTRDEEHSASTLMNFVVVRSPSPYNGIIGRPGVRKLQAVPSTVHRMLKIPTAEAEEAFKTNKQLSGRTTSLLVAPIEQGRAHRNLAASKATVPKSENKKVDALSKIASTSFAHLSKQVLVEELKEKFISAMEVLAVVEEEGDTWMTPIFKYLTDGTLPVEAKKARVVKRKLWRFSIINGTRYKKSFLGPWLRFGLPGEIISDNGKQFHDNPFKDWCEKLCIRQHFASVKHPQTNGLVERANPSLREGIKARLDERSKNWMEELPHVLWAHRTMIKTSNGDTLFSLTYGTEAVIPAEIGMPTLRTTEVDPTQNNEALEIYLDLLEEQREQAAIRDLVYRNNKARRVKDTGKLGPKWEGQYEVTEALGKEAYKLRDRDGNQLPQTWNISNLKKCYVYKM
ncbi:reverse transcriptase domain-containing protein [Tanacetum coccineum]